MGEQNNCPGLSDKNYCLACNEIGDCQNFKSSDVTEYQRTGVLGTIISGVKTKIGKLVILLGLGTITLDEITDYLVYKDLNSHSPNIEQPTEYFKEKERLDELEYFTHLILKIIISIFTSFILYLIGKKDEEINLSNEKSKNLELIISRLIEVLKTLKEKEALLNDALDKLELSNSAKGAFLANLAHDFRNPLNAISGFAQMLSMGFICEMNDGAKGVIETILKAVDNLLNLINDMLDSTKAESGKIVLSKTNSDISKILRDILQILVMEADRKEIKFDDDLIQPNIELDFDDIKIKRVLINIIGNAIKFTQQNGKIAISLTEKDGVVSIVVVDDGMGIRAEDLDKLCTPFVQGKHSIQGTGLGLHISKEIIKAHSGTFEIDSEGEGKGTKVTITLPKN